MKYIEKKKYPNKYTGSGIIPAFFPLQKRLIIPQRAQHQISDFDLFQPQFASLATANQFQALKPYLMECDIGEELKLLKGDEECLLEVSIPLLGLTDLLQGKSYQLSTYFAPVIAINGFGAKNTGEANNFPQAEFVKITDIVGNQYEVTVDPNGNIELPGEGSGYFSLISKMTFIYSANQVLNGRDLENCEETGIKKNMIYFLIPQDNQLDFTIHICITHFKNHQRIVKSIRELECNYELSPTLTQQSCSISKSELDSLLHVDVAIAIPASMLNLYPFFASITLTNKDDEQNDMYHQEISACKVNKQGWLQHPLMSNVFTKYFGLSKPSLIRLIRDLYSQYDLMKDYLKGDRFDLKQDNGYNNFLLRPEAFEYFHALLVRDLINQKIKGSFIFSRIPQHRFSELNNSLLAANFHDSMVLEELQQQIQQSNLQALKALFLENDQQDNIEINEQFAIFSSNVKNLPEISMNISFDKASALIQHRLDFDQVIPDFSMLSNEIELSSIPGLSQEAHYEGWFISNRTRATPPQNNENKGEDDKYYLKP